MSPSGNDEGRSRPTSMVRRGGACRRCRAQKIRCDDQQPACSNCAKIRVECMRPSFIAADEASRHHVEALEERIRELEGRQRVEQVSSHTPNLSVAPPPARTTSPAPKPNPSDPLTSPGSCIDPSQPLAHEVGLLSLGNSAEPKYLGPSSGVTFARLIYAAAPQTQGFPSSRSSIAAPLLVANTLQQHHPNDSTDVEYFLAAYLDEWHLFYPFMHRESLKRLADRICRLRSASLQRGGYQNHDRAAKSATLMAIEAAQILLVLALGARALESRFGKDFGSEALHTNAMENINRLQLHDSLAGVQTMLLLVLCSLCFPTGLNAWFLTSTIIASCLDLGLQRRTNLPFGARPGSGSGPGPVLERAARTEELRSCIFWSAYSLERGLAIVLGRPLTLRDEALDIRFPGQPDRDEVDLGALQWQQHEGPRPAKRKRARGTPMSSPRTEIVVVDDGDVHEAAVFSFRFDRILAEIKLMVYRVAASPDRFPWPQDLESWRRSVHQHCRSLLNAVEETFGRTTRSSAGGNANLSMNVLSLKYHQCLLLLNRPSPAFRQPSAEALRQCFHSASETLRIHSEMNRFGGLTSSWTTAHTVFVSGISVLYCLWLSPLLRQETSLDELADRASACTSVLGALGKVWSVAEGARVKFERLYDLTMENWTCDENAVLPTRGAAGSEMFVQQDHHQQQQQQQQQQQPLAFDINDAQWTMNDLPSTMMDELADFTTPFDLEWLTHFGSWPMTFD